MNRIWQRAFTTLVLLATVWLGVGLAYGKVWALGVCALSLLVLLLTHVDNLSRLFDWLAEPKVESLPWGSGVWHQLFYRLHRVERRRAQALAALTANLDRLRDASEAIPDGVVILDAENRIEWCNAVAATHFALDDEQDRGYCIANVVRLPNFIEFLEAGDRGEPLILRAVRGTELTLSLKLAPVGDRQKLLMSRDITQIDRVDSIRRDFVANVSHELKTPLTVLAGFIETFEDLEFDEQQIRRYLGLMREQTSSMQRLVKDLLTLSSLESKDSPPREDAVNMRALLESLHQEALVLSKGRHQIRLSFEADADLRGAETELRSAFGNLISNAIRYTPPAGKIAMSWRTENGEGIFAVEDTGIGIDSQHLPRLVERFYRVDRSRSRETGGTGLGLAIVKHVLSRHQAALEISSEPGRGSRFSARFPRSRVILAELATKPA